VNPTDGAVVDRHGEAMGVPLPAPAFRPPLTEGRRDPYESAAGERIWAYAEARER
jgi:hypothetical protein